jgi:acyl carrier protein
MERAELESKLMDLMARELDIPRDEITPEASFTEDLEVDSLGVVELLMALEDEFGVRISDDEAEGLTTVGEAIELVDQKMKAV